MILKHKKHIAKRIQLQLMCFEILRVHNRANSLKKPEELGLFMNELLREVQNKYVFNLFVIKLLFQRLATMFFLAVCETGTSQLHNQCEYSHEGKLED